MPRQQVLITPLQLGQILQASRKAKGLSQSALATRLGLSQQRVSELELGAGNLSVEQLLAWCAVLGLELSIGLRAPAPADDGAAGGTGGGNPRPEW